MAKHARTTITIPPDLKGRMEAVEEPVNWSAIACQAFEQKLAEFTKRRGARDMKEVADRLRASKQKHESVQYNEGQEAGRQWAKDQAEAGELILLERWRDSCRSGEWSDCFATDGRSAYAASEHFVFRIWPESDGARGDAQNFWEQQGCEDHPQDEFVHGFADGALEVWDEVKDQL
jgi:hypothetical protein